MSAAACLSINSFYVHDTEGVAGDNTTLVETEPVLLLSISFVHKVLVDFDAVIDNSVCLIFNLSLLIFSDPFKLCNVKMRSFNRLFGSILPDMGAKHFAARCKDNVSTGMMSSQLRPAERVNLDMYLTSFKFSSYW